MTEECTSAMDKLMHTFMCIKNVRKIAEKCVDGSEDLESLFLEELGGVNYDVKNILL